MKEKESIWWDLKLPAGCDKCNSTFPCEETCGANPFTPKQEPSLLEPCPFCNHPARLSDTEGGEYVVGCDNCSCSLIDDMDWKDPEFNGKANVIEKWNTRATTQKLQDANELLDAAIDWNWLEDQEHWPDTMARLSQDIQEHLKGVDK